MRRTLGVEVVLVLAIAVGLSAMRGIVSFTAALTAAEPIAAQAVRLNVSRAPGRPYVDLAYQLVAALALLLPALLAIHLARRDSSWAQIGLGLRRWGRAALAGVLVAAVIGGGGLALYLGSRAMGASLEVQPSTLSDVWWRIPVLVLSAAANAILEEVVVVGYLLRRLDQLGVPRGWAAAISAVVRSSYHVYQGLAGVVGNLVMGWLFARAFQRYATIVPLIVAHFLIDVGAFVGYALLADRVAWL